jgi:hypothetical protein
MIAARGPLTRMTVALATLALLVACGDGGDDTPSGEAAGADSAAVDPSVPTLITGGRVQQHADAGFQVFWPSGCGVIKEQVSDGRTRRADRELIYSCDRDGELGEGTSVRVMFGARGPDGEAPDAAFVVALVERQLQRFGVRALRQRPLSADGIEGVEVHAGEPAGPGEVWLRGLLRDRDVYLLLAWNTAGGLFDDPQMTDFFASFRLDPH